jgi:Pyruvate/2-oxoacid:ferredoxin oxidoreductase delta subunit
VKLEKVLARVDKKPLNLCFGLCVGNRDRKSTCRECVNVCPQGLLKIGEYGLSKEIDLTECKSCGLCATVCPNGVLEVSEPSDLALLKKVNSLLEKKEKLTVGCYAGGGRDKKGGYDLTLTCLGRLNEAILVAASAMGAKEVLLKTYACRGCEKKTALSVIERSVENSQKLLQAFGKDTKIVFLEEAPVAETSEKGEEKETEATYERRGFLQFLKGGAFAVAAMVGEGVIDHLKETVSPRKEQATPVGLEYRVPAKRQILIHFLRKLGEPKLEHISGANLPLAQVRIQENCSLCDCCSQFCPTGALKSTTIGGTKGIEFSISLCTGCGLCKLACSDGALSLSDTIETAGLIKDEAKRVVSFGVYKCAICDQEFGASVPKKYCGTCERKLKLRNAPW